MELQTWREELVDNQSSIERVENQTCRRDLKRG